MGCERGEHACALAGQAQFPKVPEPREPRFHPGRGQIVAQGLAAHRRGTRHREFIARHTVLVRRDRDRHTPPRLKRLAQGVKGIGLIEPECRVDRLRDMPTRGGFLPSAGQVQEMRRNAQRQTKVVTHRDVGFMASRLEIAEIKPPAAERLLRGHHMDVVDAALRPRPMPPCQPWHLQRRKSQRIQGDRDAVQPGRPQQRETFGQ